MTHIPKSYWPEAFKEGRQVAANVLGLNRELKEYKKTSPREVPTDRELTLAACVNVFWSFKLEQDAAAAARRIAIEKSTELLKDLPEPFVMRAARCRKALNKILARTEGEGFLTLWERVDAFLAVAKKPEYWEQFKDVDPSTVILALVEDLSRVAQQGADNGQETTEAGDSTAPTEREAGTEGSADQADGAAENGAHGAGIPHQPGEDGPAKAVRGGGEGVESEPRGVQEPDQEPSGPGGQDPGRSEGGNGGKHGDGAPGSQP